jgi:hypothetical protein
MKFPFMAEKTLEIASDQDVSAGVQNALSGLGMSLSELRDQAHDGRFQTERARLVWSALRDVVARD